MFNEEYLAILIFFSIIFALACCMAVIPLFLNDAFTQDKSKLTTYECGFDAEENIREGFNVRFLVIAILFIIFDVEIVFLFPWVISVASISVCGFFSVLFFLFVLLVGFVYEIKKGALDF